MLAPKIETRFVERCDRLFRLDTILNIFNVLPTTSTLIMLLLFNHKIDQFLRLWLRRLYLLLTQIFFLSQSLILKVNFGIKHNVMVLKKLGSWRVVGRADRPRWNLNTYIFNVLFTLRLLIFNVFVQDHSFCWFIRRKGVF